MKKIMTIISTLLVLTLLTGNAFALESGKGLEMKDRSGYDCPQYNGQGFGNSLTQEQKDQMSAIRQKFIDETYKTRAAKLSKAQEIRMLMETSNPDRARLIQLSNEIIELNKELVDKKIDLQLAIKKIAPELVGRKGGRFGKEHRMWSNDSGWRQGRGCDNF
ncbi:MAG: periplasmic heavy metal sensor [Pseudomonadota bacterium]